MAVPSFSCLGQKPSFTVLSSPAFFGSIFKIYPESTSHDLNCYHSGGPSYYLLPGVLVIMLRTHQWLSISMNKCQNLYRAVHFLLLFVHCMSATLDSLPYLFFSCLGPFYLLIPLPWILSAKYSHGLLANIKRDLKIIPPLDFIFFLQCLSLTYCIF